MKKNYSDRPGIFSFIALILVLTISLYFTEKQNVIENHKEQILLTENRKFVCSIHPEVIQDVPGNCPICGAALIETIVQYKNNNDTSLTGLIYQTSVLLAQ